MRERLNSGFNSWGDKRKVYITSVIAGFIIGKLIRFFICKKGF